MLGYLAVGGHFLRNNVPPRPRGTDNVGQSRGTLSKSMVRGSVATLLAFYCVPCVSVCGGARFAGQDNV